jgi:hypothetical protein
MSRSALRGVLLAMLVLAPGASGRSAASPTLYVSPAGNDTAPCSIAQPCLTFGRAYRAASPGARVEVAGGTYATQTIPADASKAAGPDVVFGPAPGARVSAARVAVYGSHVAFRDMSFPWSLRPGATDVTLHDIVSDGQIDIVGARNVAIQGGEIYSSRPVTSDSLVAGYDGIVPTNIVFDGVYFHDWLDSLAGGVNHHIECLQVGAANGLTIENSRFRNCFTHDIFVRSWGLVNGTPSPIAGVLIENNWLAATTNGYYTLQVLDDLASASAPTSAIVRYNTALQGFNVRLRFGSQQVVGNILPSMTAYACSVAGRGYDFNVYQSGVRCGSHDRVGSARLVDPAAFDLRLLPGSAAIDAGDPANHPAADIVGNPRGGLPDAGAWEAGAGGR